MKHGCLTLFDGARTWLFRQYLVQQIYDRRIPRPRKSATVNSGLSAFSPLDQLVAWSEEDHKAFSSVAK
jgi:hypothetical protein